MCVCGTHNNKEGILTSNKQAYMAGDYERIRGKGNRFSSTNQPKHNGRKPKLFTILKKKYGIDLAGNGAFTNGQIEDLLQSLLCVDVRQTTALNMTINSDIRKIAEQIKNGEQPELPNRDDVIAQVFIALSQAINRETSKGESNTMRWIIEKLYGKATQPIEGDMQVNNGAMDLSALSDEELLQYHALLEKIKSGSKEK